MYPLNLNLGSYLQPIKDPKKNFKKLIKEVSFLSGRFVLGVFYDWGER